MHSICTKYQQIPLIHMPNNVYLNLSFQCLAKHDLLEFVQTDLLDI